MESIETVSTDLVKRLINEALQQSPTEGNGFGFAMAVVTFLLLLGIGLGIWRIRVSDARAKAKADQYEELKRLIGDLTKAHAEDVRELRETNTDLLVRVGVLEG